MRVLVLGGQGQTGSYLSPILIQAGHEVMSTQLRPVDSSTSLTTLNVSQLDITKKGDILKVIRGFKPQKVVNLGSMSSVFECEKDPALSFEVNYEGVRNVVNACLEFQQESQMEMHFIQAGSSEMYVGLGSNVLIDEDSPLSPKSIYGKHKAQAFEFLSSANLDIKITQAILFNHESPRRPEKFVSQKIVRGVIDILNKEKELLHFGNMNTTRDWSFAGDVAEALHLMLKQDTSTNYIVGSNSLHSVEEFYLAAARFVGLQNPEKFLRLDESLLRINDNNGLQANNSKITSSLNWKPKIGFKDLVEMMMKAQLEKHGFKER